MSLFSVIVPIYNAKDYIKTCLDSIAKQSFQDFELILVCDGPDADIQICRNFTQNHPNCHLIENVNKGLGGARNAGIKIAHGKYIAFVDADDWIEPDFLEILAQNISSQPDVLEFGYIDYKKAFIPSPQQYSNFRAIIKQLSRGFAWNKLWKTEFLRQHQLSFLPDTNYEDIAFCLTAAFYSKAWKVINYAGYHYIFHPNSLSHCQNMDKQQKRLKDKFNISQKVLDFYKGQNVSATDLLIVENFLISQLIEPADLINKTFYLNYKKLFERNKLFQAKKRKAFRKWLFQFSIKKRKFILCGHSFWKNKSF